MTDDGLMTMAPALSVVVVARCTGTFCRCCCTLHRHMYVCALYVHGPVLHALADDANCIVAQVVL